MAPRQLRLEHLVPTAGDPLEIELLTVKIPSVPESSSI
jgi:hypothetical protein